LFLATQGWLEVVKHYTKQQKASKQTKKQSIKQLKNQTNQQTNNQTSKQSIKQTNKCKHVGVVRLFCCFKI